MSESVHAGIHNYALKIQKRVAGGYGPDVGDENWSPLGNPQAFLNHRTIYPVPESELYFYTDDSLELEQSEKCRWY